MRPQSVHWEYILEFFLRPAMMTADKVGGRLVCPAATCGVRLRRRPVTGVCWPSPSLSSTNTHGTSNLKSVSWRLPWHRKGGCVDQTAPCVSGCTGTPMCRGQLDQPALLLPSNSEWKRSTNSASLPAKQYCRMG